ncbi:MULTISPECIES: M23 family metallopeptidase [Microbacterium]|jgi:murein DD-endopeptidase MepM/ murein hydrolase activator NlpD|uniref:M23 family metallopeptidase n=1 Tax=Microbacterium TaxID=33882 RepID=UPI001D1753CE|nr:M23 family metallopeptidase [Microbacterium testaceum]MCC4248254.1 M23 family metallopeptidase [Microbacterium testaceum]
MPAPAVSVAALTAARSRTGRRMLLIAAIVLATASGIILMPMVLIAAAVATGAPPPPPAEDGGGTPSASGEWGMPLAGGFTKGRGFGHNPVIGCAYCSVNHQGYDMAQGCGSTIYAAGPGTVITAGSYQGYGNTVRIDHGDRLTTLYGHMLWGSLRVQTGDTVTAGTPIGAEGNTGKSFGCHLHYEVIDHGTSIDPAPFMNSLGLALP